MRTITMLGASVSESKISANLHDDFSGDGKRMWVVSLRFRSAARFEGDKNLHILASPESTASICGLKIRNHKCNSPEGGTYVHGLVFEAAGELTGSTEAAAVLANLALPYLQVCALAANAAFSDDYEMIVYAPPTSELPGRFHTQRSCVAHPPAPRLRHIDGEGLKEVLQGLQQHLDEERLHRAMAHFRIALNYLEPWSWVLSAEHLFIATENLQRVIFKRLCGEANLPVNGASKHELAVKAGFDPVAGSSKHLSDFDSHIRLNEIFEGDKKCYMGLKFASDHFEHGSRDFGEVRDKAQQHARHAFKYVRNAILCELGVSKESCLFDKGYEYPLGAWHPHFELWGTYTHPGLADKVILEPDSIDKNWPPFHGLNMEGRIAGIADDETTKARTITFKADGNGSSFVDGQTVTIDGSQWVLPRITDSEVIDESDDELTLKIETRSDSE